VPPPVTLSNPIKHFALSEVQVEEGVVSLVNDLGSKPRVDHRNGPVLVGHGIHDDSVVVFVHVKNITSVMLQLESLLDELMISLLLRSNGTVHTWCPIATGLIFKVFELFAKVTRFFAKLNEGVISLGLHHIFLGYEIVTLIS
jgi:hypothetical protein